MPPATAAPVLQLHVITDEVVQTRFTHAELAHLARLGGADVVQYRDKRAITTAQRVHTARTMLAALAQRDAPPERPTQLLINDRLDVALAAGVLALHVGRDDLPAEVARRFLGAHACIGVTANDWAEAQRLAQGPVDYIGVGPVFGTQSKAGAAAPMGLATLRQIVHSVPIPVIAIGHISADNVQDVVAAGVAGIAVLSAAVCALDPAVAVATLREALDRVCTLRDM